VTNEASPIDPRPPRHCYKCGREIGPDETICNVCNRAGMATPSASQYHGTMAVAIIAGVVALALWASLSMRGVGPYQAEVVSVTEAPPDGATVTISVVNQGTARGSASCRLEARDAQGRPLRSTSMSTGRLDGGQHGTFSVLVAGLTQQPSSVVASCR
jgi:predicted nucleic acid-binding Zn ribbon protein